MEITRILKLKRKSMEQNYGARAENEAYLMRIVEIPVRALEQSKDKNYGDDAVREVQKHFGVAGPVFIEHVLHRMEEIQSCGARFPAI